MAILALAVSLAGCRRADASTEAAGRVAAVNPCGALAPTTTPALPTSVGLNQVQVDCSASQAFIALNWKADPTKPGFPDSNAARASFGLPGDTTPKVWESYLGASAVFAGGPTLKGMWRAKRPAVKMLGQTSKFGDLDLSAIAQAGSGDHWLTNQRGDVTYYEILMNQDEYEFITQDGFDLTTAAGQLACARQPGKPISDSPPIKPPYPPGTKLRGEFNLPAGQLNGWDDTDCAGNIKAFGQDVGAMEIKAAWTPLPPDHSLDYRY